MYLLTGAYFRMTEPKGQAMSEGALILAAVGVVAFLSRQPLGIKIGTVLNNGKSPRLDYQTDFR